MALVPHHILTSPLDGTTIAAPAVRVNQDTSAAAQNEPSVAVDPNNALRLVVVYNDYIVPNWDCVIDGIPCSIYFINQGAAASCGSYFSNDGGATWCCPSSEPGDLGTLLPGISLATGGPYQVGSDPRVAFDTLGNVYCAGLGYNQTSAPNSLFISRGTFGPALSWGLPKFINPTTAPSMFSDEPALAIDTNALSAFKDRIYLSWTRFAFNPNTGTVGNAPIFFAYSSDGGQTFSTPQNISDSVKYCEASKVAVSPDGTIYCVFMGATKTGTINSMWSVKSTNGGVTWTKPVQIATVAAPGRVFPKDTIVSANSRPRLAVAPNGDVYIVYAGEVANNAVTFEGQPGCDPSIVGTAFVRANCRQVVTYSKSTDGGATWSAPTLAFTPGTRTAEGYPAVNPDGSSLNAPAASPIEDWLPSIAISAAGDVYISAYRGTFVSPWQSCASAPPSRELETIDCLQLGNYIHNTRFDYVVNKLGTGEQTVSTHPINTRYQFLGTFMGDNTDIAVGPDGTFHAVWTDTNELNPVHWQGHYEWDPTVTIIHQQDIATRSGT